MKTIVKWNTDIPSFDSVAGKRIIVEYRDEFHQHKKATDSLTPDQYRVWFGFGAVDIRYAILTDEVEYCEWANENIGNSERLFPGCVKKVMQYMEWKSDVDNMEYKYCPHCGNPIKIIEEVKPMELDGVKPKIHAGMADGWVEIECTVTENNPGLKHIRECYRIIRPTKNEAITAWNAFVSRMGGEK